MDSHHPRFPTGPLTTKGLAVAALVSGLALASPALLAEDAGPRKSTTWGLGLGVVSSQEPYIDVDTDTTIFPLLHIENRYVRFFGTTLEAKLPDLKLSETNEINFRLIGRWDRSGYKSDDSWMLEGMEEREGGIWAGAKVKWQTSLVDVSADWTHDVSGNSKGQRFNLGLDRSWQLGERFTLTPRIGATWYDRKYVDYYYGVWADEVRAGRPEYHGESGINTEVGLQGIYRFNKHHSMVFDVRAKSLSAEIKDSPLVDSSTDNRVVFGYMYHF